MIGNIKIESEPIGSLPRPISLIDDIKEIIDNGGSKDVATELKKEFQHALNDTISRQIKCNQSCITDGEQTKISFIGYPIFGSNQFDSNGHVYMDRKTDHDSNKYGVSIGFQDQHSRHIPVLSGNNLPFRYAKYASDYVVEAKSICADKPYKQAIISPSALMLVYPSTPIPNYSRDQFIADLLNEAEKDIRQCFEAGAKTVQLDATELRLSLKLDPSGGLFGSMVQLIGSLLSRFTVDELKNIGIHECRGGDQLSPHSETVDIVQTLLPALFKLPVGRFYIEYAQESNRSEILQCVKSNIQPHQIVFFGCTKVSREVESVDEILKLASEIASVIPHHQFGLTDTCGFSPFFDDKTLSRDIAFSKMLNRSNAAKLLEDQLNNK